MVRSGDGRSWWLSLSMLVLTFAICGLVRGGGRDLGLLGLLGGGVWGRTVRCRWFVRGGCR